MKKGQAGLTLVELLVAMALIGIVFAMVSNWQVSTLSISTRTNAMSQRLTELNDVTGYVGDRVRSAITVRTGGFTVNAASASNSGQCDATTPCLAVLVRVEEAESSGAGVVYKRSFLRLIYRVESRSTWSATDQDKVANAWADNADNKIVILREYRERCAIGADPSDPDCSAFVNNFSKVSTFAGLNRYLVADHLTSVNQAGGTITPFAYNTATKTITLAFQSKQRVQNRVEYMPTDGPYSLQVQARNVP